MFRSVWTYVFITIAVVAVAGGGYYVLHRQETVVLAVPTPIQSAPADVQKSRDDEELAKKRREGIGTVTNLQPVELGPSLDQEQRTKNQAAQGAKGR